MEVQSQAKIISCNLNSTEICASAARISTTPGTAMELFQAAKENPKNSDLIAKVLKSGHKSIIEHAVFTIAFWNVSAVVEQYFIESRLASFTVKSRRYVDFSNSGYYIPPELDAATLSLYQNYMNLLFSVYQDLLDIGVPKEDARFVLPYSFHSNFYCTLNARELVHIIGSIQHGRGRHIPELRDLARQLVAQIGDIFPSLIPELEFSHSKCNVDTPSEVFRLGDVPSYVEAQAAASAKLIDAPSDPLRILRTAHQISTANANQPFRMDELLASDRPRELEQLNCSFLISDITLSGITHLVRHRMQSIIVPPVQTVNHSRFILPASIKNHPDAWKRYHTALNTAHAMLHEIAGTPPLKPYSCYFAVSGNMMDVMTTANARELKLFLQLRTCSRAQWEIRGTAVSMLRQLREHCAELYNHFGPSCYLLGFCPEGRLSCGKMDEVCTAFAANPPEGP